jgi:hypothetical protein
MTLNCHNPPFYAGYEANCDLVLTSSNEIKDVEINFGNGKIQQFYFASKHLRRYHLKRFF